MKLLTVAALLAMAWFAVATDCASEDRLVHGDPCQKEGAVCNDETTTGGLEFCVCEASQWKCTLHGGCNGVFCDEERVMTEGDTRPAAGDKIGRHGSTSTTRSLANSGTGTTNKKPHTHVHDHVHVHDNNFKCSQLPVEDGDTCTVSGAQCHWEDSETSSNCICSINLTWECKSDIDVIDESLVIDLPNFFDCPTDPVETGTTCSDDYAYCSWNDEGDFFTECSCISSIWECTDWGPNGWANCSEESPADGETCSHRGSICYWTGNSEPLTHTDCFCSDTSVWECAEYGEFGWIGCPALPTLSNFSSCDTENAFCFWDIEEVSTDCSCFDGLWTCYEWHYEDPYNCSETPSENGTSCSVAGAFCSWGDGTEVTDCYCSENSIWECSEFGPYGWIGCTDEPFPADETCGTNGAFCYWEQDSSYTDCFCYKNAWDCVTQLFYDQRPAYDCSETPVEDGETCSTEGAYCSWTEATDIYSDCTCSSSLKWECYESGPSWYEPPSFDCPEDPLTNGTSCAIPDYASCSYSNGDITTQCDCFGSRFNRDEAWHCTDRGPFGWVGCPSKPVSNGTTCTEVPNYSACIWPDGVNSIECTCFDATWGCYEYSPFGSIGCPSEPVSHGTSCSGMEGSFCYWEEQGPSYSYVDCSCDGPTWECYKNGYVLDDSPGMLELDDPVNLAEKNSDQHDPRCFKACNAEAGEDWICKEKFLESGCEDCNDPVDICTKLCKRCGGSTADAMIAGLLCDCSVGVGDGRN